MSTILSEYFPTFAAGTAKVADVNSESASETQRFFELNARILVMLVY